MRASVSSLNAISVDILSVESRKIRKGVGSAVDIEIIHPGAIDRRRNIATTGCKLTLDLSDRRRNLGTLSETGGGEAFGSRGPGAVLSRGTR